MPRGGKTSIKTFSLQIIKFHPKVGKRNRFNPEFRISKVVV